MNYQRPRSKSLICVLHPLLGKKPTLEGGPAHRCEYVQLFKWEPFPRYIKLIKDSVTIMQLLLLHSFRQVAHTGEFLFFCVSDTANKNETSDISGLRCARTVYSAQGRPLSSLPRSRPRFLSSPAASYLARAHGPCRVWFSLSQRQFKGISVRLVPISSSSLFSRHWQPAIWDPLGLITPPLDSLTMHPPLLLLSSALFSSIIVSHSSVAT